MPAVSIVYCVLLTAALPSPRIDSPAAYLRYSGGQEHEHSAHDLHCEAQADIAKERSYLSKGLLDMEA